MMEIYVIFLTETYTILKRKYFAFFVIKNVSKKGAVAKIKHIINFTCSANICFLFKGKSSDPKCVLALFVPFAMQTASFYDRAVRNYVFQPRSAYIAFCNVCLFTLGRER